MKAEPFQINIPQTVLDDLKERLAHTRWTDEVNDSKWDYGTNLEYLKGLVNYWQNNYDWRKQEKELNKFPQFKVEIEGLAIHFIHMRSKGPNPKPLILFHGWPDSFYRYYKVIPMLTEPEKFGGNPADAFDVVVPSQIGFGFSSRPNRRGYRLADSTEKYAKLMSEVLGYKKYGVAGGDTGSAAAQLLAFAHPEAVMGVHLTDLGRWDNLNEYPNLTVAEQQYIMASQGYFLQEGAYAMLQTTKPQTLANALNDSPAGSASWIIEKFYTWSDCQGNIERCYSKDELLTNIMIYWVTQTINSSMRFYYEEAHNPSIPFGKRLDVPVGMALFPKDSPQSLFMPRSLAERVLRIEHWTEMPRGGHFSPLEEPRLYTDDVQAFFRKLK